MNKNIARKPDFPNGIIKEQIKSLPLTAGVYLYRDKSGKVIYVGKAVNLRNRVSSYFNEQDKDSKTKELIKNIAKLDTIETGSEFEALILESDLVKRYKPKYNVRLRDDKSYIYLKISKEDYPRISLTRRLVDTEAEYLGPFIDSSAVKNILRIARKIFPYCSCNKRKDEVCLYYHLGLCPGHSAEYISRNNYAKNIGGIKRLFSGKAASLKKEFTKRMKAAAKHEDFESAVNYRDKLKYLDRIEKSHFISERDLSADTALVQLQRELGLSVLPKRIECYDISNIMGTAAVGSMVVFNNGIASPKDYRRFQIRTVKGANDYAMLAEVLSRRFKTNLKIKTKNTKNSLTSLADTRHGQANPSPQAYPDLVILDGGKGQLSTVLKNVEIPEGVKVVALAKRKEEIFSLINPKSRMPNTKKISNFKFQISNLPTSGEAYFLVQRIRDEAHRFAITYHRKVKSREMYETSLDAIPGVGSKTKKKLIKKFGSIQKIKGASFEEIASVVGKKLAKEIEEKI